MEKSKKVRKGLVSFCSALVLTAVVALPVFAAQVDICAEVWKRCRDAGYPAGYCIDLGVACDALTK